MFDIDKVIDELVEGKPSSAKIANLITQMKKDLGITWVKDGTKFGASNAAVLWSGEGAFINDPQPGDPNNKVEAFNYYYEDEVASLYADLQAEFPDMKRPKTTYEFGVQQRVIEWSKQHGLHWEAYDPGTFLAYED